MTREQKIAEAKRLREQGLPLRYIARELGVGTACIWRWLNPERAQELNRISNAKRSDAKRQWARDNRAECPQCGADMGAGTKGRTVLPRSCRACIDDEVRSRMVRYIELRKEGLTNRQIAEREKVGENVVAKTLWLAGRYGLTVPRSPYFDRGKEVAK